MNLSSSELQHENWLFEAMFTNLVKLISPDFFVGKTLIMIKAIFDIIVLIVLNPSLQSLQFARAILKIKPRFTMVKNKNLINLYYLVQKSNIMEFPGDIVECGVWNGGSAAMMGFACLNPGPESSGCLTHSAGCPALERKMGTEKKINGLRGIITATSRR